MKKILINLSVAGLITAGLIGCGPSAEEKAAAEQHVKDSIAAAEQAILEAAQQKATEDSLAIVQAMNDSIAAAKAVEDSIAASKPNKPKSKPKAPAAPTKPEEVKPGQGRG